MNTLEKDVAEYQSNLNELLNIETKIDEAIAQFQTELSLRKERDEIMREKLKYAMKDSGFKKFETDYLSITYVAETKRVSLDTKKLKEEKPDLWNEYSKTSDVKDSVRIKVK